MPAPYYYVPGNHDSVANRRAIAAVDNVTLVDREVVDIDGVRILGVADPTFTATNEIDSDEAADLRLGEAPEIGRLVERARPDVLAVHDPRLASEAYGHVPLVVAGHTDAEGGDAHNLDLSNRRAAAVVAWLVEHGIDAGRLQAEGHGEARPVAANDSAAGRALNRRVELRDAGDAAAGG